MHMLTNREIAISIWLVIVLVVLLLQKDIRSAVLDLVRGFMGIAAPIAIMLLYISLIVFVLHIDGIWEVSMTKDSIIWVIGGAFVMLFNSDKAMENETHLKDILIRNLTMLLIVEYLISQYVFALWFEILLVPVLTILAMLQAFAGTDKKYLQTKGLLDGLLGIIGIALLAHAIYGVVLDINNFATLDTLRTIALPIILTLAFLPFLYGFVLWMKYENVFVRLKVFTQDKELARYAKWKIFLTCGLGLHNLNLWSRHMGAWHPENRDDVHRKIHAFKISKEAA